MKRTSKAKLVADTAAASVLEMGALMETVFAQKCSSVQIWTISGMHLNKKKQKNKTMFSKQNWNRR